MATTTPESATNRAVAILVGCIAQTLYQDDPTFLARLRNNLDELAQKFQKHGGTADNRMLAQARAIIWDENLFPRK